jgi:hypothetical protein
MLTQHLFAYSLDRRYSRASPCCLSRETGLLKGVKTSSTMILHHLVLTTSLSTTQLGEYHEGECKPISARAASLHTSGPPNLTHHRL